MSRISPLGSDVAGCSTGVSEDRRTLLGRPFKGVLFYLGYKRGTLNPKP